MLKVSVTVILPVVLYVSENLSLTLREKHVLKMFKNRMLRETFGPKAYEIIGGLRKLHIEGLHS
jgi:hypothetical protein